MIGAPEATRAARTTTNPKVTQWQKDTEAAFIYLQQLHYDHVDNPMPDCLAGDIRALPHNRFGYQRAQFGTMAISMGGYWQRVKVGLSSAYPPYCGTNCSTQTRNAWQKEKSLG